MTWIISVCIAHSNSARLGVHLRRPGTIGYPQRTRVHRVTPNIRKIRDLGCRIALDDFGTGYSSLSYLTRFPPDRLKIDRSFIQDVDTSISNGAVVKAIMSLAKTLGLLVTAEGVERQGQLSWLRDQRCDEAQGFLLAKPLSPGDFEAAFLMAPTLPVVPSARRAVNSC